MSGRTDTRKANRRQAERETVGKPDVEYISKDPRRKIGEYGVTVVLEPACTKARYRKLQREAKGRRRTCN